VLLLVYVGDAAAFAAAFSFFQLMTPQHLQQAFMDLEMPVMDGIDCATALRSAAAHMILSNQHTVTIVY
jgi:CheY-like chemotaxis protein